MNHFFRTVVCEAGEGDSNCKHTLRTPNNETPYEAFGGWLYSVQ